MLRVSGAIGYYLPNIVLSRLVFVRQREIFETFTDAADLLMVCVEAGRRARRGARQGGRGNASQK